MQNTLTDEQQTALATHDRSVSLAAGAGCGKTFVLIERFLAYLDPTVAAPKAELHELVAITFTDAAAREMRDRLRRRCHQRCATAKSPAERQAWHKLMRTIDAARISTIHSLCAELLRTYAAEASVDPNFELLDGPAAELLRLQTVDDRLRELLVAGDERLLELATRLDLKNLRDTLVRLVGQASPAVFRRWSAAAPADLVETWQQYHQQTIVPAATHQFFAHPSISTLRQLCATAEVTRESLRDHLQEIGRLLDDWPTGQTATLALAKLRSLAKVQGVCSKKDWLAEEDFAQFRDVCKTVRAWVDRSILRRELCAEQLLTAATVGLDLLQLVADTTSRYEQAKRERNALEFDDLLRKTHQLLHDPRYGSIRTGLQLQLLMVDEFQDTDPLQVEIVQALCGEDWPAQGLFVVGDFKQSIYRFRGAQPTVSSQLRAALPPAGRLALTTNFRSQPALLDFVNAVFCEAFEETYQPLVAHRPQQTPTPAVEFLWATPTEPAHPAAAPPRPQSPSQQLRRSEATGIARRVAQLLDEEERLVVDADSGQLRALQLGDIAILLRSLSDVAIYEEALREYGLDYYLAGGHAFYAQQEIYDILHLLRAVASPADELSLAGALRSPLFAWPDETLWWLVEQHGSLQAGLEAIAEDPQCAEEQSPRVRRAAQTLQSLRDLKDGVTVAELLQQAIALTGYDAVLLAEFLGERKLANLHKLVEQARALDRIRPGDLTGFITQLTELVARAPKEPLAAAEAHSEVIRLMTIHHAKGLEFPCVVVPDLNRKAPPNPRRPVMDEQLGPLVPLAIDQDACDGWQMRQFMEQQEELAERLRVLYVACTRAADYLILSCGFADLERDLAQPHSDWLKFLQTRIDLASGQCHAPLPTGYPVPAIRVTTDPPATQRRPGRKTSGVDLVKLVEEARGLAASGSATTPRSIEPIPRDRAARKRFSFSRLSGQLRQESRVASTSRAQQPSGRAGLDPQDLGTLVHAVLERIDFHQVEDLPELCHYLAPQYVAVNETTAATAAVALVQNFLASPSAAALRAARVVRREVEFLLPWQLPSSAERGHYLHGFLDCLYQDTEGNWHLLDYKSNQVTAADVPQVAQQYALQMFVYTLACTSALGTSPSTSALYFLQPQLEFHFQWDDTERAHMTAQFNQAILSQLEPT